MNLRVGLLVGVLMASLFLGALPNAAAQTSHCGVAGLTCQTTTQIVIQPQNTPIKPLGPFVTFPIQVSYTYQGEVPVSLASTAVDLRVVSGPAWAVATLSPSQLFFPLSQTNPQQGQQTATLQAFLLVTANAEAPAFQQGVIEVTATAADNGGLLTSTARTSVPVQADFFSIIEAVTETQIQKAKPQAQVSYPLTVSNFGNAQIKVNFDITQQPDGWQVQPPTPITLESRQAGGQQTSRTANMVIQTPYWNGYLNVVGVITARLSTNYALDTAVVGDTTIVSTLTTTKGFYVPGFEPLLAFATVGGLALAMNRFGRRPEAP